MPSEKNNSVEAGGFHVNSFFLQQFRPKLSGVAGILLPRFLSLASAMSSGRGQSGGSSQGQGKGTGSKGGRERPGGEGKGGQNLGPGDKPFLESYRSMLVHAKKAASLELDQAV